jgi:5-methylcytosine-specific restriction protein B
MGSSGYGEGLIGDQSFNQHRPFHIGWLIEYLIHWRELEQPRRAALLADPWLFAADAKSVEFSRGAHQPMREAWLFMMFPEVFESISSRRDKGYIREAFSGLLPGGLTQDIDADILEIRGQLTPEAGEGFHFYRPPIVEKWRVNHLARRPNHRRPC